MYLGIGIKISWEIELPNKGMTEHNNQHVGPLVIVDPQV